MAHGERGHGACWEVRIGNERVARCSHREALLSTACPSLCAPWKQRLPGRPPGRRRGSVLGRAQSEEHTSELQSHLNLVCRLLLEKKKHNHHHQEQFLATFRYELLPDDAGPAETALEMTIRPGLTDVLLRIVIPHNGRIAWPAIAR